MLLDLGRNDAGKVSKINTVKVTESFTIERYSHVMHIVSNVTGVYNNKYSKLSIQQLSKMCDRKTGIGADGVIILVASQSSDFEMKYYNWLKKTI